MIATVHREDVVGNNFLQLNPGEPWQSIFLIWTPLSRTAVGGREEFVKLLLKQDDVVADSMNKYGGTAGHRY